MRRLKESYFSYSLLYFSYFFAMGIFSSILSIYLSGNGKTASEVSFIVSAGGIFTMVMQPFTGMIFDKAQKDRTVSIVLLCLSGIAGVLFAASQSTLLLFLVNGFTMAFLNGVNPVCERMATATKYRYGTIRLWGAVGYAAASQTAGWSYEHIAPRFNFYLFGIAVFATMAAFFLIGKDGAPVKKKEAVSEEQSKGILRTLAANRSFLLFMCISFLFSGTTGTNNTYLPILLNDRFGGATLVGSILFFATLMEIPLILWSNRYMDKISGKALIRLDLVLLLIQYSCYAFCPSTEIICIVLFLCKSTATMLFIMVTLKVVLGIVDAECSTTALSLVATAKAVGSAGVNYVAGAVSDAYGTNAVFMLLFGLAVIGFGLTFLLKMQEKEQKLF